MNILHTPIIAEGRYYRQFIDFISRSSWIPTGRNIFISKQQDEWLRSNGWVYGYHKAVGAGFIGYFHFADYAPDEIVRIG